MYGKVEVVYVQIGKIDAIAFRSDVVFPVAKRHVLNLDGAGFESERFFLLFLFLGASVPSSVPVSHNKNFLSLQFVRKYKKLFTQFPTICLFFRNCKTVS